MNKEFKSPYPLATLEENTGFLFWQLHSLWSKEHKKVLENRFHLTHTQFAVMSSLYWLRLHGSNEVSQSQLALHTKIEPMTVSQSIKILEKKGYIKRVGSTIDARANSVLLTETGTKFIAEVVPIIEQFNLKFFAVLKSRLSHFNNDLLKIIQVHTFFGDYVVG
ncbi:MAG: MarR family winged helix-turn-helix transcriptional regulator [Candidatus Symbiothrix sp.]|jgi:DNA-binding MarR family transcriptional regulator|nr:MarR family winged helix-turn-helix transcriptional regulator [Candidatus Symbiothrix sp.]